MIIDTHAHLDMDQYDTDRDEVIERARQNGVDYILNIGCDVDSSARSLELAERFDVIYATAGVHPHDVKSINGNTYADLKQLLAHPKMIAVGETGLDYFKNYSPQELQREHLKKQLELAKELDKPIIVHCRDANEVMISILSEFYPFI